MLFAALEYLVVSLIKFLLCFFRKSPGDVEEYDDGKIDEQYIVETLASLSPSTMASEG